MFFAYSLTSSAQDILWLDREAVSGTEILATYPLGWPVSQFQIVSARH